MADEMLTREALRERVARALCDSDGFEPDDDADLIGVAPSQRWKGWLRDAALAAVAAAGAPALRLPRCGDHVLHRPSGEEWVVAWAEGNDLAPAGWPNGIARVSDCEVTRRCSDAERAAQVEEWRAASDDPRRARVLRLYGGEAPHG